MIKILIPAGAVLVLLTILTLLLVPRVLKNQSGQTGPVTVKYWGFDDELQIKPLVDEFEKTNPSIKVEYSRQVPTNYRTRVQTQIREGVGPDVFKIHNSWTTMFTGDLYPAPSDIFSLVDYQSNFFPVVGDSFISNEKIYGVPDAIDGLALYYNEDILSGAGLSIPKTWQEFIDAANKVTVKDPSTGAIKTAGAALGSTANIDHWSDILGLLLLQQPGVNLEKPGSNEAAEVLTFYTGFIIDPRKKVWDTTLPNSTSLFAQGSLAFYFGPSIEAARFKQANPNLKFNIAPVPQLPGRKVAWGSFWGESVAFRSKYPKEAWTFVKFLSTKEQEKQKAMATDPLLSIFVSQGPFYKSWFLSGGTQDVGLNDEMIKIWEDAINSVLAGTSPLPALQNAGGKIKAVMDKYTAVPTPTPKK